jgi:hypothetical protein
LIGFVPGTPNAAMPAVSPAACSARIASFASIGGGDAGASGFAGLEARRRAVARRGAVARA